eukprot:3456267-Pyramimonas_sp.AAC.1
MAGRTHARLDARKTPNASPLLSLAKSRPSGGSPAHQRPQTIPTKRCSGWRWFAKHHESPRFLMARERLALTLA